MGVPKLKLLLSQNFERLYLFQIKSILKVGRQYLIPLENIFPTMYSTLQLNLIYPDFKGFVVGSQIFNLTPAPSFDHNS